MTVTRRTRQLANQIAGSILLSGTASPAQVSETLLVDLRDADWTTSILRELWASMASWGLDDRGGLFSKATYGDVGFLVASPDPASTKKTFVGVGKIGHVLGPLYAKTLGEDEPFRKRRLTGHVFEGQFEEMHISEVMTDIVRRQIYVPEPDFHLLPAPILDTPEAERRPKRKERTLAEHRGKRRSVCAGE
ncbi:hypothetical protein EDB92DRAFT_970673 [Lactarius akahatsu]|uniref:Uncharacterized protein n=1 Tax=Lactarius akahatsu TaxID=416441 RepID=A0AAD4LTZ9_9AGAM|nr:hypothetical protein EDB92DRAFT_970673 [Lactarius akahatsu]